MLCCLHAKFISGVTPADPGWQPSLSIQYLHIVSNNWDDFTRGGFIILTQYQESEVQIPMTTGQAGHFDNFFKRFTKALKN